MIRKNSAVAARLQGLRHDIETVARASGRDPQDIRLLAVSKTFAADVIEEAWQAGQRLFGENRVQEAEAKIPQVRLAGIEWHLIGHLQSNKARRALELFNVIQSVDSEKLARQLGRYAQERQTVLPVFIDVNIGQEPQKHGILPDQAHQLSGLVDGLPGLRLVGLMALPPFHEEAEKSRPYFRRLRDLLDSLNRRRPGSPLAELSMGMSHDYRVAIEEGATLLRIGTAIFGPRAE